MSSIFCISFYRNVWNPAHYFICFKILKNGLSPEGFLQNTKGGHYLTKTNNPLPKAMTLYWKGIVFMKFSNEFKYFKPPSVVLSLLLR